MKTFVTLSLLCVSGLIQAAPPKQSTAPDDRFKADLLLVVAHPDDETEIGPYLAKAAFDEHKRIAVVFGTRGNSGGNAVGPEQAAALANIREIEGRRALAYLGITNVWFLDAPDTPGQDVLRSLETWDHGRSLGRLVRIVRLTRPAVIATWLPAYTAGENHGDHQAASVIATEAFDAAGDPTQFSEQVTPARDPRGISNLTEGLHAWQSQKLYYFSDASHVEFLKGQGPEYSATAISPSKGKSYARLSTEECAFHLTQSDSGYAAAVALDKNDLKGYYFLEPARFVFGKSHVDGSVTGDLFEDAKPQPIPFKAPPGYKPGSPAAALELGGPWHFYNQFRAAHGISHLDKLVTPEVEAGVRTRLNIPLLIHNSSNSPLKAKLTVDAPAGWTIISGDGPIEAGPSETKAAELVAAIPASAKLDWQNITARLSDGNTDLGNVTVRVHVASSSLPQ